MDAKMELASALCAAFPGTENAAQIQTILDKYTILYEAESTRSNLKRRIGHFLAAKKIDGLSARTIKNYRYIAP